MIRQEHAIEVQPSENRPENLENYDEYAEESVKKPLETPVDNDKTASKNNENTPKFVAVTPSTNETEPISNVDDVFFFRTVKPLCNINEPCN